MKVIAHETVPALLTKIRLKAYAPIKDRLRAVVSALKGVCAAALANRLEVAPSSVKRWVKRWNEEAEVGLWDKPRPGQPKRLTAVQQALLFQKVEQGPPKTQERGRYRLVDLCGFVKESFGVLMKKGGMQDLLHRNGYRLLRARPVHEKNEKQKMEIWVKEAPLLSKKSRRLTRKKKSKSFSKMRPDMDKKEA